MHAFAYASTLNRKNPDTNERREGGGKRGVEGRRGWNGARGGGVGGGASGGLDRQFGLVNA